MRGSEPIEADQASASGCVSEPIEQPQEKAVRSPAAAISPEGSRRANQSATHEHCTLHTREVAGFETRRAHEKEVLEMRRFAATGKGSLRPSIRVVVPILVPNVIVEGV